METFAGHQHIKESKSANTTTSRCFVRLRSFLSLPKGILPFSKGSSRGASRGTFKGASRVPLEGSPLKGPEDLCRRGLQGTSEDSGASSSDLLNLLFFNGTFTFKKNIPFCFFLFEERSPLCLFFVAWNREVENYLSSLTSAEARKKNCFKIQETAGMHGKGWKARVAWR